MSVVVEVTEHGATAPSAGVIVNDGPDTLHLGASASDVNLNVGASATIAAGQKLTTATGQRATARYLGVDAAILPRPAAKPKKKRR